MKISETPIKERFDDILDLVVLLHENLQELDEQPSECVDDCNVIVRRLTKLKDYVLEELDSKNKVG